MTGADPQRPFTLPAGATEVLLVRHGSSRAGEAGADHGEVDGHSDPPLSPMGQRQAMALGRWLAAEPVGALFVTPLRRTAETAAPLSRALGVPAIVVPALREVFLGEVEHDFAIRAAAGDPLLRRVVAEQRWDVIPGAEPMGALADRVASGLTEVVDRTGPDRSAVVVSHAGVIAEACRQATGSQALAFLPAENASITRLVRSRRGRWTLRSFNDTAHLRIPTTGRSGVDR